MSRPSPRTFRSPESVWSEDANRHDNLSEGGPPDAMNLRLTPARREKLADILYGQILEQIAVGRLVEGDRLPSEAQISEAFGVSRPVVREALMRLQVDGIVYARRGSGSYVKQRPPQQLVRFAASADIAGLLRGFEARVALEPEVAGLAAERASEEHLAAIEAAFAALESAFHEGRSGRDEDFAFHRAVAEATGNELFPVLLDSMRDFVLGSMEVALRLTSVGSDERRARVIAEHRQIVDAIASKDRAGARLFMNYHLVQARSRLTRSGLHP